MVASSNFKILISAKVESKKINFESSMQDYYLTTSVTKHTLLATNYLPNFISHFLSQPQITRRNSTKNGRYYFVLRYYFEYYLDGWLVVVKCSRVTRVWRVKKGKNRRKHILARES